MRKAINFDINTKAYETLTNRSAPIAYYELRIFLEKNGFIHRQGSGYVSEYSMNQMEIHLLARKMADELPWTKSCIREIDVTTVGKQYSLLNDIQKEDVEIEETKELEYNDYELEI